MNNKNIYIVAVAVLAIINLTGLFNEIFIADSSLYATIAKSMSISGDYLNLYVQGKDWLDKPHFPFWVCALFIKIFGTNTFAYKIPSILFFFLGLTYTYKLARLLYNKDTAILSVLMLSSALHIVISNNDTRAESILLALIIMGVYYMYRLTLSYSLGYLILAAVCSAAAVMTKGIFVLIILYSAIIGHLMLKKQLKRVFHYWWLLLLILTALFCLPELYALYIQFDLHPEKIVFGRQHVSGIEFFLWDSQFGRFTNTGPIKGEGDITFFFHTLLWAFAPWSIIGLTALVLKGKEIWNKLNNTENLTFAGFITMFIIFSISKFQLPHYLNIIYPFLSILSAALLIEKAKNKTVQFILKASTIFYAFFFISIIGLLEYFYRPSYPIIGILLICVLLGSLVLSHLFKIKHTYIMLGLISSISIILYLNFSIYPHLLEYQSGAKAAKYINEEYPQYKVITSVTSKYLLEYYSHQKVSYIDGVEDIESLKSKQGVIIYTDVNFLKKLDSTSVKYKIVNRFKHFHITRLTPKFINYKTRNETLKIYYLIVLSIS